MYIDDIIGVGLARDIENDLLITRNVCTSLLGPSAVADDKTEVGRRVDVIGYTIDLTYTTGAHSKKKPSHRGARILLSTHRHRDINYS